MDLIDAINNVDKSVRIEKFSAKTGRNDLSREAKNFLAANELCHKYIWRCKIGVSGFWYYGVSLQDAISNAINKVDQTPILLK